MKSNPTKAKRLLACRECGRRFLPRVRTQRYCDRTCNNRAAQRRLRDRYRKLKEQAV